MEIRTGMGGGFRGLLKASTLEKMEALRKYFLIWRERNVFMTMFYSLHTLSPPLLEKTVVVFAALF